MKLIVKDVDIATGHVRVVLLNSEDARLMDLHHGDRIEVHHNSKTTTAILDIAESKKAAPKGKIGCFEEVLDAIHAKEGDTVTISIAPKPQSLNYIKRKIDGHELTKQELYFIVKDIVDNKLTDIELTSFVIASYAHKLTNTEIAYLTQAMKETGDVLKINKKCIVDFHSIGGVPGNRTTLLVVPILVAAGLTVPKTSSRAITSPAGTADTMEVFCSVTLNKKELLKVIDQAGGFITWGGAVNLAPADERIIQIEHPLSIDAEGQMLASIMAKKASVGATHLLIEIPTGNGAKVKTKHEAKHLEKHFLRLGKLLGIKVKVIITDGTEPIGNGIGPVLEARDVIWALTNDPRAPKDLIKRSIEMAAIILEFVGKTKKGNGTKLATEILQNGKAHQAFTKIVKAQKGNVPDPDKLQLAKYSYTIIAEKDGQLACLMNDAIAKTARLAGAPQAKTAGIYIHKHCGDTTKKGEPIMTIYAANQIKLAYAISYLQKTKLTM